jgi:adenylosuccinate lyase
VTCASALCVDLLAGLEVHAGRMRANVEAAGGLALSEHAVRALEPGLGLPAAYAAVRRAALATQAGEFRRLADALRAELSELAGTAELGLLGDPEAAAASASAFAGAWARSAAAGS